MHSLVDIYLTLGQYRSDTWMIPAWTFRLITTQYTCDIIEYLDDTEGLIKEKTLRYKPMWAPCVDFFVAFDIVMSGLWAYRSLSLCTCMDASGHWDRVGYDEEVWREPSGALRGQLVPGICYHWALVWRATGVEGDAHCDISRIWVSQQHFEIVDFTVKLVNDIGRQIVLCILVSWRRRRLYLRFPSFFKKIFDSEVKWTWSMIVWIQ